MTVQFSGVDWGQEQYKAEVRFQKRKLNKQKKKNRKTEEERLRRFRRFLHGMGEAELSGRLTSQHVLYFYRGRDVVVQNRRRLIADLASDEMLNSETSRAALVLLRRDFEDTGLFGAADEFLQSLFAFPAADLRDLVNSHFEIFRAYLEAFYSTADDAENRRRFLECNLRVGHLGEEGADLALELRQRLIDGNFLVEEADGAVSSSGSLV